MVVVVVEPPPAAQRGNERGPEREKGMQERERSKKNSPDDKGAKNSNAKTCEKNKRGEGLVSLMLVVCD